MEAYESTPRGRSRLDVIDDDIDVEALFLAPGSDDEDADDDLLIGDGEGDLPDDYFEQARAGRSRSESFHEQHELEPDVAGAEALLPESGPLPKQLVEIVCDLSWEKHVDDKDAKYAVLETQKSSGTRELFDTGISFASSVDLESATSESVVHVVRVVVMGRKSTGKKTFIKAASKRAPSLGVSQFRFDDVLCQMWVLPFDAESDVQRSLADLHLSTAHVLCVLYDVCAPVKDLEFVTSEHMRRLPQRAKTMLIGTKADLTQSRVVLKKNGFSLAKQISAEHFEEVSALKDSTACEALIKRACKAYVRNVPIRKVSVVEVETEERAAPPKSAEPAATKCCCAVS